MADTGTIHQVSEAIGELKALSAEGCRQRKAMAAQIDNIEAAVADSARSLEHHMAREEKTMAEMMATLKAVAAQAQQAHDMASNWIENKKRAKWIGVGFGAANGAAWVGVIAWFKALLS